MKIKFSLLVLIFVSFSILGNEEVLITAERSTKNIDKATNSVEVITAEDIKDSTASTLTELLETIPSLFVSRTGPIGQSSSVFIRGASSDYSLVLIDGIKANDPTTTGGGFQFAYLNLGNIERIEIIKGPQSVLYGGESLSGVISIITKRGQEEGEGQVSLGLGSFNKKTQSAYYAGKKDKLEFNLGFSNINSEGISAFNSKRTIMAERDSFNSISFNGNFDFEIDDKSSLKFSSLVISSDVETDLSTQDSRTNGDSYNQLLYSVSYDKKMSDVWNFKVDLMKNEISRKYISTFDIDYTAETSSGSIQNNFLLSDSLLAIIGGDLERTDIDITSSFSQSAIDNASAFSVLEYDKEYFFASASARYDNYEVFGDEITYRVGAGLSFDSLTFKGSFSTGFKAPSAYQVYSSFGNLNLRPTSVEGHEFSLIKKFESISLNLNYFNYKYTDEIDFVSSNYVNINKSSTKGLEVSTEVKFLQRYYLAGGFSLLRAIDESDGSYLSRRPREKGNLSFKADVFKNFSVSWKMNYIGHRNDGSEHLNSVAIHDISSFYKKTENLDFAISLNNIFNKEYEIVKKYGTPDFNFDLKTNYRF